MSSEPPALFDGTNPAVIEPSPAVFEPNPEADPPEPSSPRPRFALHRSMLGAVALTFSLLIIGVEIYAIVLASAGHWLSATILAWGVIVLTSATFITALVALIGGFGRHSALAALVLSVLANPLVLIWLFDLLQGR